MTRSQFCLLIGLSFSVFSSTCLANDGNLRGEIGETAAAATPASAATAATAATAGTAATPAPVVPAPAPADSPYAPLYPRLPLSKLKAEKMDPRNEPAPFPIWVRLAKSALTLNFWILVTMVSAYIFKVHVARLPAVDADMVAKHPNLKRFSSGAFDCLERPDICFCSCFCPALQWANTMEMTGMLSFWTALLLLSGLMTISQLPFRGAAIAGLFVIFLVLFFRRKMRRSFDMPDESFSGMAKDCFLVCCCFACSIAQEARHVDVAYKVNHEAVSAHRPFVELPPEVVEMETNNP